MISAHLRQVERQMEREEEERAEFARLYAEKTNIKNKVAACSL